jgi:hypothetical protein
MSSPPEIRQNSAQAVAAALDRGASLPASPPDVHPPPSPLSESKLKGASPLSSQIVSTITASINSLAGSASAAGPATMRLDPHPPSFSPAQNSALAAPQVKVSASMAERVSPSGPPLGIDRQQLFEQRQKMVLAIGRTLERERKPGQQHKHAQHKHGAEGHLREGFMVRLLQALGLLGDSHAAQGPQTILDRLVSFLAASLKRVDLALFRKSASIPRTVVQKTTTIEEREEMEEATTDAAIPLNERSGPTPGTS